MRVRVTRRGRSLWRRLLPSAELRFTARHALSLGEVMAPRAPHLLQKTALPVRHIKQRLAQAPTLMLTGRLEVGHVDIGAETPRNALA